MGRVAAVITPEMKKKAEYGSLAYVAFKFRDYLEITQQTRSDLVKLSGLSVKKIQTIISLDENDRLQKYAEPPATLTPTMLPNVLDRLAGIFSISFENLARETGVKPAWGQISAMSLMGRTYRSEFEDRWLPTNAISTKVSWAVPYRMDLEKERIHVRSIRSGDIIFVDLTATLKDKSMYVIKSEESETPIFAWYCEDLEPYFAYYPPIFRGKKTPQKALPKDVQIFGEVVEITREIAIPTMDQASLED